MSDSRISKRYARALFSLGKEDGSFATYGRELNEFKDLFKANAEFGNAVSNQIYAMEERKNILLFVLEKSGFSSLVKNFLKLLLDKNRIGYVETIAENYAALTDEASNIVNTEIITARPIQEDALQKVIEALKDMTSKDIKPEVKEDPELIGGIVVKIGDLVLDGSIKAQLEGLKESFKRGE
ncbi:ATP synthase F1 subunit delta [Thermodesulfobacteriota bacterium]